MGNARRSGLTWAWTLVFAAHGGAAALTAARAPHAFPVGTLLFFANDVAPAALCAACLTGGWAGIVGRPEALRTVARALPLFWLSLGLSARVAYPESLRSLWLVPALVGLALAGLGLPLRSLGPPARRWVLWPFAGLAAALGAVVALGTGAPAADTRPGAVPTPALPSSRQPPTGTPVAVGAAVVDAAEARLSCGGLDLLVRPLLTFRSVAADRFWATSSAPARVLEEWGRLPDGAWFSYAGAFGRSYLELSSTEAGVDLVGWTRLGQPVWSHLNSFVSLRIPSPERLSLRFSATGEHEFEISPADYPAGRPMHLAWLEPDGSFRVALASSAEKGPFQVLASGPLEQGAPLALSIRGENGRGCRVGVEGWAEQAGFAPSPTAGWGLPVNAIEFLRDPAAGGEARVFFTLAATSVGWGLSSAGHCAGDYHARVTLRAEP